MPTFEALRPGYAKLWADLVPAPEHVPALQAVAAALVAHKATYEQVAAAVWGRPELWFIPALIDQMEHEPKLGLCNSHLHNGDPLTHQTVNVPAGRPPGAPPFTFIVSACDALIFDDLDKVKDWPIERVAYQLEAYNGWGYLNKPVVSPYLAAWSNKYTAGKYVADHVYDANAVSGQPGALTILKILAATESDVAGVIAGTPAVTPTPTPAPAPPPQGGRVIPAKEIPMPNGPMTVSPATAAAPALPAFNLRTVEVDLEMLAPIITMIAGLVPGGQVVVPFIPAVEAGLKLAADVQAAPDATGKLAAVETHLHDIANVFGQVKGLFPTATATK